MKPRNIKEHLESWEPLVIAGIGGAVIGVILLGGNLNVLGLLGATLGAVSGVFFAFKANNR